LTTHSSSRRIQGIFIACLVLLGACGGSGGMLLLLRWKSDRTTPALADQSAQFLSQSLLNQKRSLEILRDTLEKAPGLSEEERRNILGSASTRIPHLAANGWITSRGSFTGWTSPKAFSAGESELLFQEAMRQSRWKRFFGRPSTLLLPRGDRTFLVFVQPLRASSPAQNLVSVVDLNGLLSDLMQSGFRGQLPLQVTQENRLLYRSRDWVTARPGQAAPASFQRTVRFDGIHGALEVQSRGTPWLSPAWFNTFALAVGLLTGLSFFGMVWAILRLRHLATTDELTALNNRRFFLERWREEVARAKRYKRELSCLILDINGFKRINDRMGHPAGDQALQQVAAELQRQLRRTDVLARFGGDEFIVALPETTLDQALAVAEKLRGLDFGGPETRHHRTTGPVTLSVGSAHLQENDLPLDVIGRADQDLYASRKKTQILSP